MPLGTDEYIASLDVKFAAISGATSGNNTVVAAVSGKKIRVLSYVLNSVTAVAVRFESDADGTALTGVMSLGATSVLASGFNPFGHFETVAGELLNMELGGAVQVSGHLTYVEID